MKQESFKSTQRGCLTPGPKLKDCSTGEDAESSDSQLLDWVLFCTTLNIKAEMFSQVDILHKVCLLFGFLYQKNMGTFIL